MTLAAGIHRAVPMEDYVRDCAPEPSLSASCAHTMLARSSLHAWYGHPKLNPNWQEDEDGDFDLGSAAHAIVLERAWERLAVWTESETWQKKAAQEFRAAARNAGQIPVLKHQHDAIVAMEEVAIDAIEKLPETAGIFNGALIEHTLVWQEGKTWCRCRPDLMRADRGLILSYKTSGNAEPDAFIRGPLVQLGYALQAAHELAGNMATGGVNAFDCRYVWLVQETKPPYACSFVGYGPMMATQASAERKRALALWQANLATNKWPGYRNEIHWAEFPAYHAAKLEEALEMAGQA